MKRFSISIPFLISVHLSELNLTQLVKPPGCGYGHRPIAIFFMQRIINYGLTTATFNDEPILCQQSFWKFCKSFQKFLFRFVSAQYNCSLTPNFFICLLNLSFDVGNELANIFGKVWPPEGPCRFLQCIFTWDYSAWLIMSDEEFGKVDNGIILLHLRRREVSNKQYEAINRKKGNKKKRCNPTQ